MKLPEFPGKACMFDFSVEEAGGMESKLVPQWWQAA